MIHSLIELEVEGFRIFRDNVRVPLNADVVLIHGSNGSGKTGLLQALEYSLTGAVGDLQAFADDYPRCLKRIHFSGPGKVSLQFADTEGEMHRHIVPVGNDDRPSEKTIVLSKRDRRFYVERCYLSQARLGRLLELYQGGDSKDSEQPLIRFVRELLGLDLLENLTAGLYEAGDIRRLEKVSRPLARLREEQAAAADEPFQLLAKKGTVSSTFKDSLDEIQNLIAKSADPNPGAPWTVSGMQIRIESLRAQLRDDVRSKRLQEVRELLGRLDQAVGFLKASASKFDRDSLEALRARLAIIEQRVKEVQQRLAPIAKEVEEKLQSLDFFTDQIKSIPDIAQRLDEIEVIVGSTTSRFDAEIQAWTQSETEMRSLEQKMAQLEIDMKALTVSSPDTVEERRRWADTLRNVAEHIMGDICPVCERDYSELDVGDLKSRVLKDLNRIGEDIQRLETAAKSHAQLEAEKSAITHRISALKTRAEEYQPRLNQIKKAQETLSKLSHDLSSVMADREAWKRYREEKTTILSEIKAAEIQLRQQEESIEKIRALANEIGLEKHARPTEPEPLAEAISSRLQAELDRIHQESEVQNRLLEAIVKGYETAVELQVIDKNLNGLKVRQERLESVRKEVDAAVIKARGLARAATNAKKKLLDRVFNETLNCLWLDLFERLVKFETFKPRLSEPISKRGQIRAGIQGFADGIQPFEQLAAVLGAGNLNTAALSLFLSLHLIEEPRHRLLVLDDPVQNMDDVHIVQLASLLRALVRQAERQLVVAVHERALYDYLCLELGPTRDEDSLLAIELVRDEEGDGISVHHERKVWKTDLVELGM